MNSSPLISQFALIRGSNNSSTLLIKDLSINKVSTAPQIPGLLILLLRSTFFAILRSAFFSM